MRVNVFLNKQHVRDDGTCRVGMYVSANGRGRYMFPFYVRPEDWNDRQRRVKPGHLQHVEYNRAIAAVVSRAEVLALESGATGQSIVAALDAPQSNGVKLHEAIAVVLKERANLFAPQTLERLGLIAEMTREYLPNATVEGLTSADVHRYRQRVGARPGTTGKPIQQNTLRNRVKLLRALYRHACEHYGVQARELFSSAVPGEEDTEARYLDLPEVKCLQRFDPGGRVGEFNHAFLLAVYLGGTRFGDMRDMEAEAVAGPRFIPKQEKTGRIVSLPIIAQAREIIDRYKGGKYVLPFLRAPSANSMMNEALKRIAMGAGVNPKLSTHYARGTWANWAHQNNVDIYTISKVLGHRSIKTTVVYLSKFPEKKVNDAFEKMEADFG